MQDQQPSSLSSSPATAKKESSSLSGLLAALTAFVLWGLLPVYWKLLEDVSPVEVLSHRISWSFVFLLPLMLTGGRLGTLLQLLQQKRMVFVLACNGFLLAINWYIYIWAINSDMVIEASLGYYITPLMNILFGVTVFKEKGSPLVWVSIGLAALGVGFQVVTLGHLPLVPLGLALSFATYTLVRKITRVQAIPGLFIETLAVLPFTIGYLYYQWSIGKSAFLHSGVNIDLLLVGTGIVTSVPLLCFALGTRRISMTTLGLLQYINPCLVFLLGIFAYKEPLTTEGLITFACIWTALALYTWETIRKRRW